MSLAHHFNAYRDERQKNTEENTLTVHSYELLEISHEAKMAESDLDTMWDQFHTEGLYEALTFESVELSDEAQRWKGFMENSLNVSVEDDKKDPLWKRMIEAIKAFFAKIRDKIKAFVKKVSDAFDGVLREAEKLKKKADSIKDGEKPKSDTINDTPLYGRLGKNAKGTDGPTLISDIKLIDRFFKEHIKTAKGLNDLTKEYEKTLEEVTRALPETKTHPVAGLVPKLVSVLDYPSMSESRDFKDLATGMPVTIKSTPVFPGGGVIGVKVPNGLKVRTYLNTKNNPSGLDGNIAAGVLTMFSPESLAEAGGHKKDDKGDLPTLTPKEVSTLCSAIIDIRKTAKSVADEGIGFSEGSLRVTKTMDKFSEDLRKIDDKLTPVDKKVTSETLAFGRVLHSVQRIDMYFSSVVLTLYKDTLGYCKESLKQYP